MKNPIFKTSLIISLVLALLGLTVSTFAMWDQLTTTEDEVICVGVGTELTRTERVISTEGRLIPKSAILGPGDVHEVEIRYELKLSKQTVEDLLLDVEIKNVRVGGIATLSHFVLIDLYKLENGVIVKTDDYLVNNTGTIVILKVTLLEPQDQNAYEMMKNKQITFDVEFSARKVNWEIEEKDKWKGDIL